MAPGMEGVAALTAVPALEVGASTAVEVAARDAAPAEPAELVGDGAWGASTPCGPCPASASAAARLPRATQTAIRFNAAVVEQARVAMFPQDAIRTAGIEFALTSHN